MELNEYEKLLSKIVLKEFCQERHLRLEKDMGDIKMAMKERFEKLEKSYNKIMWLIITTLIAVCLNLIMVFVKKGG